MNTTPLRRWLRHATTAVAVAAAAALVLTGCTDPGAGGDGEKPTLTIALNSAPTSLDPSKGSGGPNQTFQHPAYSTLLHLGAAGADPEPALAESWQWLDDANTKLEVVLHEGLTFSDGTVLDAEAVKTSIEHFAQGPSSWVYVALPIDTIEADGLTVVFNLKWSAPTFPRDLAEGPGMGAIISPTAIADDPDALGTSTAGAGPYMLTADGTIDGSEYRYIPNPEYYDPESVQYSAITIKVIADANTALGALKSGQVDVTYGYPDTFAEVEATEGLQAFAFQKDVNALYLQDWTGDLIPALGDVRVRQALNYAIDRQAIVDAVTKGLGVATTQAVVEGTLGYDAALEDVYPYDPEKARDLLAEAGYADGFDLPIVTPGFFPTAAAVSQAIAEQLGEVGVRVTITSSTSFPEFAQATGSGQFGGIVVALPMTAGVPSVMDNALSPQALVNSRHGDLADVNAAAAAAAALSGDEAVAAWRDLNELIVTQAYIVPVEAEPSIFFTNDTIGSLGREDDLNPVWFVPAS